MNIFGFQKNNNIYVLKGLFLFTMAEVVAP